MLLQMLGSLVSGVFTGDFAVAKSVSGPVAIFNAVGSASSMGFVSLIQLLGLISVNLAVLNIMPFPALDGGRLLFVAIEAITGKKKNLEKIEAIVNSIGFFLLLGLMLLVTVKDVLAAIK
jgi:regulator of sigma E protease